MEGERITIECPVCDHKIATDATRCPNCGADFTVSGVEELERVARDLTGPDEGKNAVVNEPKEKELAEDKKDGLLGRLFKKKR